MTNIIISLEPNHDGKRIYYPGQMLKGTVELSLDSIKKIRGFSVTVFGHARAHWTETRTRQTGTGENRRTETYTVYFEGTEVYLNSKTYLFGSHAGPALEIQPGTHRYNFACQLPQQLPYTVNLMKGYIAYYVEAVLDIPWRFDKEFKTPFTVARLDDLNLYPELRLSLKHEEIKTFCCLFCQSGPLLMNVIIPCTGFVGGQKVTLTIAYENKSNVDVVSTKVKLLKTTSFTSHTPEHKTVQDAEKVATLNVAGVKAGQKNNIEAILTIPGSVISSNGRFCKIITVSYSIVVTGYVQGCHSSPKIYFPITIGSVPIRFGDQLPFPQFHPSAPPVADQYNHDLPPSFEEAMKAGNVEFNKQSTLNIGWNLTKPSAPPL